MMMQSPGGYEILKVLDDANFYAHEKHLDLDINEEVAKPEEEWHDAKIYFADPIDYHEGGKENLTDILNAESAGTGGQQLADDDFFPLQSSIVEATRYGVDSSDNFTNKSHSNFPAHPESCGVGVMDWSLKRRIRLECLPGRCIPSEAMISQISTDGKYSTTLDEGQLHQLALQYLTKHNTCSQKIRRDCSPTDAAMAKWLASKMYYQHPAVHPLPPDLLSNSGTETGSRQKDLSAFIFGSQSVHNQVRLPASGCMGGLGNSIPQDNVGDRGADFNNRKGRNRGKSSMSTVSTLLAQRRHHWQEAFRSMYRSWKTKLKDIDRSCVKRRQHPNLDEGNSKMPSQDELARCSFYMILPHQVILFRGGYVDNQPKTKLCIMPMIVFSSTTDYLRSKLRSMGVELKLLVPTKNDDDDAKVAIHDVFSESLLETKSQNTTTEQDAKFVHEELNAIKHADDEKGKVTVEVKKKKQNTKFGQAKNTAVPPLFVCGEDDCSAVYELLLNSYGLSINHGTGQQQRAYQSATPSTLDVPLLLCRSLGPCMHTTLRTLSVSSRRDAAYTDQLYPKVSSDVDNKELDQQKSIANSKANIELRGPVLPCALRDMTCAMVDLMMLDKRKQDYSSFGRLDKYSGKHNRGDEGVNMISYQFAFFPQSHEGESSILSPTSTGSSSSIYFNGSNIPLSSKEDHSSGGVGDWSECNHGDFVNVLVWDISRKSVVSFHPFLAST